MATYGLQVGIFYVTGQNGDRTPKLSPTSSLTKTFASVEAAETFGVGLLYPTGSGFTHEVWNSMHIITGRCVIGKEGRYLSATHEGVAWTSNIRRARDFDSSDAAEVFVLRRLEDPQRYHDDILALYGAAIMVIFT